MPSPLRICLGLSVLTILLSGSFVISLSSSRVLKKENDLLDSTSHQNASTTKPPRNFRSNNIWRQNKPKKEQKVANSDSNELKSSRTNDDSSASININNRIRKRGQVKFGDNKVEESKKTVVVSRTRSREEPTPGRPDTSSESNRKNIERTTTSQIISNMRTYKKTIPKLNVVSTTPRSTTKDYETTTVGEEDDIFNIDRYTSPEFHDVNNAYKLPLSEMSYFSGEDMNDDEGQLEDMQTHDRIAFPTSTYPYPSYSRDKKIKNALKPRSTPTSSQSKFDSDLTTPHVYSFDSRFKQTTKDIKQTLNASESDSTMFPNTSQEVKKEMNFEQIISNNPNNASRIYYKNTKKVTVSDSEKMGDPSEKLSDVHGTSIYYESSMISNETYPSTTTAESDCDNTTTTEVPTTGVPNKAIQISLIDSNAVTNDAISIRKSNDLPSSNFASTPKRRMQFTTPKTIQRISMKNNRINLGSPATSTSDEISFIHKGSSVRKPITTTISPEIDPVYQTDSTLPESEQDIGISNVSKRGSMKYTTNGTSSQKLESTLMAIPPTSTAWALITMKYPPTKNRTPAVSAFAPVTEMEFNVDSTVKDSQAGKDVTDIPPSATKYMTFSEMFGTSTQSVEPSPVTPFETTYVESLGPVYTPVDDPPWLPIVGGTTNAHSQLPVADMTPPTQVLSVTPDMTHVQYFTTPMSKTESTTAKREVIEEYTETSITVSDVRSSSNVFESITKLPNNTTTPLSDESDNSTTETSIATERSALTVANRAIGNYTTEGSNTVTSDYVSVDKQVTKVSTDIQMTTQKSSETSSDEDQFAATSDFYNTTHSIANVESSVTTYPPTPVLREEETTTERQEVSEDIDHNVSTTAGTPSIHDSSEVPITTYRPKYYPTTSQSDDYTTYPTNIYTGIVDELPLTTSKPQTTTSDDYIFVSGHSTTSSSRVSSSEAASTNVSVEESTTDVFTTQEVDAIAVEGTVPSPTTVKSAEASEDSSNENGDEIDETDSTTESREVVADDIPMMVDNTSTHSADIMEYVDGNNTPDKNDARTKTPPIDDPVPDSNNASEDRGGGVDVALAVGVSVIGVVSLALLVALLVVVRRRSSRGGYGRRCTPVSLDACSVGSVRVGKGRALEKRSYGNPAYENEVVVSHPMRVSALASFAADAESVWGEFSEIQAGCGAGLGAVPQGCEDKNRYANVLPLAETRVPLTKLRDDPTTEYINANYVSGPGNIRNYYIACQAPMANTVVDFWRMIWEQNSRLIVMLTEYMENGVEKCYEYLPPSEVSDNKRTFGDFQVVLKKREHREKYAVSALHLRHVPSGVWRDVHHMWYFWPAKGVPEDYESVIDFLGECRGHMKAAQLGRDYVDEDGADGEVLRLADADDSSTDGDADGEVHTYSPQQEQERVMRARAKADGAGNAARAYTPRHADGQISLAGTNGSVAAGNVRASEKQSVLAAPVSAVRPCVVHCSAGAGRTGALLAAEACARSLDACGACDVPRAVRHLRAQRPQAVQNKQQYMFIYRVLSEYGNKLSGACFDNI